MAPRGTISVECPPAGGSSILIQLPARAASRAASRRQPARGPILEGSHRVMLRRRAVRVLIASSDTLVCWALADTLERDGHTVLNAVDDVATIRALKDESAPVDLVLLDERWRAPAALGLIATIRRVSPRTAVALLTADLTPEVVEVAVERGAAHVLEKPFDLGQIRTLVHQLMVDRGIF